MVRCKIGSFVGFHHYFKLVHLRVGPNGPFRTLTRFKWRCFSIKFRAILRQWTLSFDFLARMPFPKRYARPHLACKFGSEYTRLRTFKTINNARSYIDHLPDLIKLLDVSEKWETVLNKREHSDHAFEENGDEELSILWKGFFNDGVEQADNSLDEVVGGGLLSEEFVQWL